MYKEQFETKHDFPNIKEPTKFLVLATTPRCGSHMFGHLLKETGQFGFPLEYANPTNLNVWKKKLEKNNLKDVLTELYKRRTSANGVFSIKIHYTHIREFGGFKQLLKILPNASFVLLSRKGLLQQAISFSISKQTGVWIIGQKSKTDNPIYNFDDINLSLKQLIKDNAAWRYNLEANGCNYIELDFDEAKNNIEPSVQKVADFLQIDIAVNKIPHQHVTKKQSKTINQIWTEKFLIDKNTDELFIIDHLKLIVSKLRRKLKNIQNK